MKSIIKLFIVLMFNMLFLGCDNDYKITEKEYSSNGLTITMQDNMYAKNLLTATVYYEGDRMIMTGLKETFDNLSKIGIDINSTIKSYGEAVLLNNKVDENIKVEDGLTYFTYERESSGKTFFYFSSLYKGTDAFWIINFACQKSDLDTYYPYFVKWAKMVQIS